MSSTVNTALYIGGKERQTAEKMASADPAKGAAVFKKCTSCHTDNQGGANGIGQAIALRYSLRGIRST